MYMYAGFRGNVYEYLSEKTIELISQPAPGIQIGMQIFDNRTLTGAAIGFPTNFDLGKVIYVKAYLIDPPDPSLILYLKKCVAKPTDSSSTSSHVLFTTILAGSATDKCAENPTVTFVPRSNRQWAVFQFQAFRFCNILNGGVMVDCEVTICLPGDTTAECTRPCHNLQHPKYSSRKRRVARGEAATKEYELNAMPMAVDENIGENIDFGYGEGYSKRGQDGN